ncbi:MAG: cupin domain-containing protein [Clostridia bacterium]|nr:cupin domain-containing protein [Clostridia bacterium]
MLEIKDNPKKGSGFDTLHQFDGWKVAFVTYAEQYGELKAVKRHTQTDEVFVLIKGRATLYTADGDEQLVKTTLEKEKLYVVQKNTWHHLQVSDDALLMVVENSDTTKDNTQTKQLIKK